MCIVESNLEGNKTKGKTWSVAQKSLERNLIESMNKEKVRMTTLESVSGHVFGELTKGTEVTDVGSHAELTN